MIFRAGGMRSIVVCSGQDDTQRSDCHPHIRRPRPSPPARHWWSSKLNKIWALRGDDILAAKQILRPSQAEEAASPCMRWW